jgi:hypothetical protein
VQFPSLMFLQRIPYQSVQRRRIRNWPLLLLRLAALALIVAAFARPFFRREALAASAAGGAREVVILIDKSYSMGYGDRWTRATTLAREEIGRIGPADRASVVFFASGADVALRSTPDRSRLNAAVATGKPGSGATRFGPALKLAGSIASESALPRREVIMISDFQRAGWQGAEGVRLPDGVTLTPRSVAVGETSNLSVTPISLQRSTFSEQDRVTVTGGVTNHAAKAASNVELTLEIDGRAVQTEHVSVEPNSSASVTFAPFTPAAKNTRGTVRIAADALPLDNAFNFTVSPKEPLRIIVAERPGATRDASLYLSRALALGETPPFDISTKSIESVSTDDLQRASVVILNDAPVAQLTAERLGAFVARGGGLLVALGSRATWPAVTGAADVLAAVPGQPIDRSSGQAAFLCVPRRHPGQGRADHRAVRRWSGCARGAACGQRTRPGVDVVTRSAGQRSAAQGGVSAVRASHGYGARVVHRASFVADRRRRARSGPRRSDSRRAPTDPAARRADPVGRASDARW